MSNKNSIKIFHTGDFHLDSPFSGLDVREGDKRRAEHRDIFVYALDRARESGCDMVLVSGDLFDCGYVGGETVSQTLGAIERCGLPVVLSPGNHDPFTPNGIYARGDLPSNLYVFDKEELSYFDFNIDSTAVRVFGYAFTSNRYPRDPIPESYELLSGGINLLCAHTELDEAIPRFAPIKRSRLADSGFVYCALGHEHKHGDPERAGGTTYCYSGFAVGRSFDELGRGRALTVEIDKETHECQISPMILTDKQYVIEKLDISGAESESDVAERIGELVREKGYGNESGLRVILSGVVSPELIIPRISASTLSLALLQIVDDTLPILDGEYLERDISLKGAFYRELLPRLRSEDENERRVAAEALRIGLSALEGKSFI